MKKFIALYYNTSGSHQPAPEMTDAQKTEMMAPWGAWQEKYGSRVVDMGSPFLPAASSRNGMSWTASKNLVTGYSIVSAVSLEEAEKMFQGHPIYNYPHHAVEISECAAM